MDAQQPTRSLANLRSVDRGEDPGAVLRHVFLALTEKGYDPIDQMVGYLLSGDPAHITGHRGARAAILRVGRDELLEELVRHFVQRVHN